MPAEINLFVSNGTCYYGDNLEADEDMIPCGNDANGHVACCQAGDNCLESSVCFNGDFGVTYVAGCSDRNYEHPSCPDKFNHWDMPWLGLAYCNGTSNEWVLCGQMKKPATLTKPDLCYCPKNEASRTMILSQSSIISGTASLPTTILGSIQFSVGHYPTQDSKSVTATTTGSPATAAGSSNTLPTSSPASTATATETDLAAPSDLSNGAGLSPSAKTGAIAGGAAGALLLAVLLAGFLCFRRRQKKQYLQREEEARAVDNFMNEGVINKGGAASEADPLNLGIAGGGGAHSPPSAASSPDTPALSELDSKAARPWSLRSELDNNASARSSYNTAGSHGSGGQSRPAPSELAAHPIAELPG